MLNLLANNRLFCFFLFFFMAFSSLGFLQKANNALPFFSRSYPTYQVNGKQLFDSSSESLVLNRIDFASLGLKYGNCFHLWRTNQEVRSFGEFHKKSSCVSDFSTTVDYLEDGKPYQSQIGYQSLMWADLAKWLHLRHGDYRLLKLIAVFLFCLLASITLIWISTVFGLVPALVTLGFLMLSTGFNLFAGSLYWSIWMLILPLAVVCLLEIFKVRNLWLLFLFTGLSFLVKFLSGYEFITTMVLAAMVPYAWDFLVIRRFDALWQAIMVGLSSLMAFALSLFLYDQCFRQDFHTPGISYLFAQSSDWLPDTIGALPVHPFSQIIKISLLNFLDIHGFGLPLGLCLLLILGYLIFRRRNLQKGELTYVLFLFLGSFSWLVVEPGHILFHPRYATLVFAFPFGFFAIPVLAYLARQPLSEAVHV